MKAVTDRPRRVAADLMDAAEVEGERQSRSAKQQLDHWARVGRAVSAHADYVDDEFQGATHGFGVGGEAAHLGAGQIPAGEGPSYSRAESPSRCPRKDAPKPGNDLLTQNLHPRHRTALCLQRHIRNRGPRRCSPDFGFLLT